MKQDVFSIYDHKAKAYSQPFHMVNEALAIRAFTANVNNPESAISTNPEDFTLYKLGSFDDNSGIFDSMEPQPIIKAIQVKEEQIAADPIFQQILAKLEELAK